MAPIAVTLDAIATVLNDEKWSAAWGDVVRGILLRVGVKSDD